ncbi:MAG TPA: DMT family transporter [Gammaproteobacteria bacterium]|nr:DMT family transporter [Gammaproteobacteria bacterium]
MKPVIEPDATQLHHAGDHPARGALFIAGSAMAFSTMAVLVRILSARLPDTALVFWRSLFALLFLAPWLLRLPLHHLGSRRIDLHLLRAVSGLLSMYCLFYALGRLKIAEATLLNQTATLFVPFIAFLWLKERVPAKVRWAILIGFTGVLLVLKPGRGIVSWPALVGLASGLTAACSVVTIRRSSRSEPATRIVFYFCLFGTLGSALPLFWTWVTPGLSDLPLLVAVGALAAAGQMMMTRGYSLAPVAQIGPFTYSAIIFGVLYGWAIWGETPGLAFWSGGLLIVLGGITALRGEQLASTLSLAAGQTPGGKDAPGKT